MTNGLQRNLVASIRAIARLTATNLRAFVEEYDDYFVVAIERGEFGARLTHYFDPPSGLVVVYGEVAASVSYDPATILSLGLGAGPLRPAIGSTGELCWRADFEPQWAAGTEDVFSDAIVECASRLLRSNAFKATPPGDRPRAIHVATALDAEPNRGWPPPLDEGRLREWLDAAVEPGGLPPITLSVTADAFRLMTATDAREIPASVQHAALLHNYHLRFFKICLDDAGLARFALEWPRRIDEQQFGYLARRFPEYLKNTTARVDGLFAP